MKYRKLPVEIEAIQWTGDWQEMFEWSERVSQDRTTTLEMEFGDNGTADRLVVHTLEGKMVASYGDFVICGVQGEFYFCKPEIFAKTYRLVQECDYCMEDDGSHLISCGKVVGK